MQEKALSQILGFFGGVTPAPDVRVKRVPVYSVELSERRLVSRRLALSREQHRCPPSRTKSVGNVPERAFVRLQGSPRAEVVYHVQPKFEAKPFAKTRAVAPGKINAPLAVGDFSSQRIGISLNF